MQRQAAMIISITCLLVLAVLFTAVTPQIPPTINYPGACRATTETCNNTVVYVDEANGTDSISCCAGQRRSKTIYRSLKKALDCTAGCKNTTVYIRGSITLNETIYIYSPRHDVMIAGQPYSSIICGWKFKGLFDNSSIGAGFRLYNTKGFVLTDLTLIECGTRIKGKTRTIDSVHRNMQYRSAIVMKECSDVKLINVHIKHSKGLGLAMYNMKGNITVIKSNFVGNKTRTRYTSSSSRHWDDNRGGGVYIRMEKDHYSHRTQYFFQGCTFKYNRKYGHYGGGMMLHLLNTAKNISINITQCVFQDNSAKWGGGLHIEIPLRNVTNISINVLSSQFYYNYANSAGGGTDVVFTKYTKSSNIPVVIEVVFQNVTFASNRAAFGAGTAISSRHSFSRDLDISVQFHSCTWKKNKAYISAAAVDIAPSVFDEVSGGIPLKISFADSKFLDNTYRKRMQVNKPYYTFSFNFAIFSITSMNVIFYGKTTFMNNSGTALVILTAGAVFNSSSVALFKHNHSKDKGGAIAMYGKSHVAFRDDSYFMFEGNSAEIGGAIYISTTDIHDFIVSNSCFFKYNSKKFIRDVNKRNTTFLFKNNTASSDIGHSIFASTLRPCQYSCYSPNMPIKQAFNHCVANFIFPANDNQLNTPGIHYKLQMNNGSIEAFPGERVKLNPVVVDETESEVTNITIFKARLLKSSNHLFISNNIKLTATGKVTLLGMTGSHGKLLLQTKDLRSVVIIYNVTLTKCPPGHIFNPNKSRCQCLQRKFYGLQCDPERNTKASFVWPNTWVGYENGTLLTANCPTGYCSFNKLKARTDGLYKLPNNFTSTSLCSHGRTGILCGNCIDGYSVVYHSMNYVCHKIDHTCSYYGILIYILTEIIPVTLIFIFIILFNISFTSGALNGFILFSQVIDLYSISSSSAKSNSALRYILTGQQIFYGLFNLKLDGTEHHCLWSGMTSLEALIMKYMTTVYALALVVTLVIILRYCTCNRLYSLCVWRRGKLHVSMLHGISAFLVICYSQCTRVTFLILRKETLWTEGPTPYNKTVVYMNGTMEWFGKEHIMFAIPALFFLIFLVILPPAILLFNSLTFQVIKLLNKRGIHISKGVTNIILMNNLKPLLDSFQGCFHDNCRCFAGLYFVYRAILSYNIQSSSPLLRATRQIIFTAVILIHASTQPYQVYWHNVLDACLLLNLGLISSFTTDTETYVNHIEKFHDQPIEALKWMQAFFLYLPIFYLILYCGYNLKKRCIKHKDERKSYVQESESWPARLLRSKDSDESQYDSDTDLY